MLKSSSDSIMLWAMIFFGWDRGFGQGGWSYKLFQILICFVQKYSVSCMKTRNGVCFWRKVEWRILGVNMIVQKKTQQEICGQVCGKEIFSQSDRFYWTFGRGSKCQIKIWESDQLPRRPNWNRITESSCLQFQKKKKNNLQNMVSKQKWILHFLFSNVKKPKIFW